MLTILYTYICTHLYLYLCVYIYIHTHIQREREGGRERMSSYCKFLLRFISDKELFLAVLFREGYVYVCVCVCVSVSV